MRARAMNELKDGLAWSRGKAGELRGYVPWVVVRKERSAFAVVVGVVFVMAAIGGALVWLSRRKAAHARHVAAEGAGEIERAVEVGQEVRVRGGRSRSRARVADDEA